MHIKEINITGFRSYRELTTVGNFSQKHNAVVGRNGSGKSSFFHAIQFVLSDEYGYLRQEQRRDLLHEGTGSRSTLANVEIVFDNSDRRIPSDSSEVRIMRQVGQKKDQYFIENKVVTRADIVNLMESAGFSRSNPYYIVKQGKITELATSPDSHRLQLIREVAGTRVFDEKKEESLKILEETQNKLTKSVTLLSFIEDLLKKLEEEKDDLKEYQKWDRMKRAIEYTIYDAEVKEARGKCDKLAAQREQINAQQNNVETELISTKLALQSYESDLRKLELQYKGKKEERKLLSEEQAQCLHNKTILELKIKDLKDEVDRERLGRTLAEENLIQLRQEIADKENEVQELIPEYSRLTEEKGKLTTDIRIAEQKCKELNAKRGHQKQFKSLEERDRHLKREIAFLDRQLNENVEQINEIEQSMREDENDIIELQKTLQNLDVNISASLTQLDKLSQQLGVKKNELDLAIGEQLENSRMEKHARDQSTGVASELVQYEQSLRRLVSKAIMNGINSVQLVLAQLRERNHCGEYNELINGYYGCVIDLFDCDNRYFQAVEVIGEKKLHFHVVENDRVAVEILRMVNEQKLPGEVNFYPLNRLVSRRVRPVQDSEARPILSELCYDVKYDVVFKAIFANSVFVRNLEAGSRVAKNEKFDCVTLEGDQVSRRGPITGGYVDVKKSRLELFKNIRSLKEEKGKRDKEIEAYSHKTNGCVEKAERIRMELNIAEMDRNNLGHEHRLLTERARSTNELIGQRLMSKDPKQAQLLQLRNRLREIEARKQTFVDQMGTPLNSKLSSGEHQLINKLQDDIQAKKCRLEQVTRECTVVENKKLSLENQLRSNLLKKRENLTTKIQDISVEEKRHMLTRALNEEKVINDRLQKIMDSLAELDESLSEYEKEKEALTTQLDELQEKKKQLSARVDEFAKNADIFCTKISAIQAKREESLCKVQEIGALPSEALGNYQNFTLKQLAKKLTECMNELKRYGNVNRKALDQFVRASGQRDELTKRIEELKKNEQSIKNLLEVLDNRRYDTLQLTFKQVAKNFQEVFKKLITNGHADLVMKTTDPALNDSVTGEVVESRHIMERFVGIGIKVSFTGSSETREMSHLSGGQKSLVALALIFAIQKCDPAPFYLFDEVDAALDPEHRKAVADMIFELSEHAQFITTTFRTELLEHAEKIYGVRFRNKVSYIGEVTHEQAYAFIQDS